LLYFNIVKYAGPRRSFMT